MSQNPFAVAAEQTKQLTSTVRQPGPPPSNVYAGTITAAFLSKSVWDPKNVDLTMHIELDSGYEYKLTKTVLEDGKPTGVNNRTKKVELLYGYQIMSHIIGAALPGKTMADLMPSVKPTQIKLYDFDEKKEKLTEVKMVTDLVGTKLVIGLQRKTTNKKTKNDEGMWVPTAERKQELVFGVAGSATDRRTHTEFNANAETAEEVDKWLKLNQNVDWDAYVEVKGAAGSTDTPVPAPTQDSINFDDLV